VPTVEVVATVGEVLTVADIDIVWVALTVGVVATVAEVLNVGDVATV
jgi:hypothetical protein